MFCHSGNMDNMDKLMLAIIPLTFITFNVVNEMCTAYDTLQLAYCGCYIQFLKCARTAPCCHL